MMALSDELLAKVRAHGAKFEAAGMGSFDETEAGVNMLVAFRALDEHMKTGAAPPADWTRAPSTPKETHPE